MSAESASASNYHQPLICSVALRLAWLFLMVALTGCVTSRMAANRIVTAPNLNASLTYNQQMTGLWKLVETNLLTGRIETPLAYASIPVGPPAAELKTVSFPAQNYRVTVDSKIRTTRDGKTWFGVTINTNDAASFVPVQPPATIVMLHGYMLSKESMIPWALQIAQAGYRVVLVDLRGHGQSTGDTVSFGKQEVGDLRQVLDHLIAHGQCDATVGVLGFSYGATLALHWAAQDDRIRTVVAVAPYNQPDAAFERLAHELKIPILHRTAQKAVALAAEHLQINWLDWSGEAAMHRLQVPVLLIGGGKDTIGRPDDLVRLRTVAGGDAEIFEVPKANHFTLPLAFHELTPPIITWFQSHLVTPRAVERVSK